MRISFIVCLALCLSACVWRGDDMSRFKFQTSGQLLDNVAIVEKTIVGEGLLPATPSNAKIFRDAQNNALIEWKRRGRINYHWHDHAGVPVSEESEFYEIEVLSGSTVVRTARVGANEAQSVQWKPDGGPTGNLTFATDGTGTVSQSTFTISSTGSPNLISKQLMQDDFVLLYESYHDGSVLFHPPSNVAIEPTTLGFDIADIFSTSVLLPPTATVTGGGNKDVAAGDQFAISHIHGVTAYYKNPTSDNSPIWYSAATPDVSAPYQIRVVFRDDNTNVKSGIRNPMLLRFTTPDWSYTADMQTADGLTPGDPLHLKIYMVSAQVGRGRPLEVTL